MKDFSSFSCPQRHIVPSKGWRRKSLWRILSYLPKIDLIPARTFKNVITELIEDNPIYPFIGLRDNSVQTNTATEWHPISYINGLFLYFICKVK